MITCDLKALKAAANAVAKKETHPVLKKILLKGVKVAATDSYICFEAANGASVNECFEGEGWLFAAETFAKAKTSERKNDSATFELCSVSEDGAESSWQVTFNGVTTLVKAESGARFPKYQDLFKNYGAFAQLKPTTSFGFDSALMEKCLKCLKVKGGKGSTVKAVFNGELSPCVMYLGGELSTRVLLMPCKVEV